MTTSRLSLAQQIAQIEDAAPVEFDPENVHDADQEQEETSVVGATAAREHYVDVGPSSLRKLHDSVADPKYGGVKTSRKQLMEDIEDEVGDEDEEMEDDSTDENDLTDGRDSIYENDELEGKPDAAPSGSDEEAEEGTEAEPQASHSIPHQSPPPHQVESEPVDDLSSTLKQKREEDRKKGKAVSRQIALWDNLLDARIRLQKAVAGANRLPTESLNQMLEEATSLSEELFELQEVDATQSAAALEKSCCSSVLLPSNRNAFSAKNSQNLKSVVQIIDETLTDKEKLAVRTQVRRGKGTRIGAAKSAAAEDATGQIDPEAFDDADFYQQLLRDVIDAKGNGAGGADDWMAVQKTKKANKKVDTKASKGRKLRYEVHEKLQNFMVPVPIVGGWHDEQIDELFASLLGKGFESIEAPQEEVQVDRNLEEHFPSHPRENNHQPVSPYNISVALVGARQYTTEI
ncbi:apoptosis-antagonizing transcription factor [Infundibulicybe gibba]|nr:apoptosis-antagonizing transcription factor [Infundibulicybe gibba]